jgi:hypothetical protein
VKMDGLWHHDGRSVTMAWHGVGVAGASLAAARDWPAL